MEDVEICMLVCSRIVSGVIMRKTQCKNCVGKGKILQERIFDRVWIQPAAGDAGGVLGVALVPTIAM